MDQLIDTDARGRASLSQPNRRYLMHEESDGTLVLEPAVVITELERRFLANTEVQEQIAYAKAHPGQRIRRSQRRREQ